MSLTESDLQAIRKALGVLRKAVKDAGIEDPGQDHRGYQALGPNMRRIVHLLNMIDEDRAAEQRAAAEHKGSGEPSAQASEGTSPARTVPEAPADVAAPQAVSDQAPDTPAPLQVPDAPQAMMVGEASEDPAVAAVQNAAELEFADEVASETPLPLAPEAKPAEASKSAEPGAAPKTLTASEQVAADPAASGASAQPATAQSASALAEQSKETVTPVSLEALSHMNAQRAYGAGGVAPQPGGVGGFDGLDHGQQKPTAQAAPAAPGVPAHAAPAAAPTPAAPAVPAGVLKKTVNLKNARAGEAYEVTLDIEGLKDLRLEEDAATGIVMDASGRLMGSPSKAGDYVLKICGLLNGARYEISANLAVIPDPKSLWTAKPSDRAAPYWKNDHAFGRSEGDLLCVAASKRGRSHAKDGTFRDDDFGLYAGRPDGWHVAAVADGAGSAKFSRHGSKLAVDTVIAELPDLLEQVVSPELEHLVDLHLQGNPEAERQIKGQLLYRSLAAVAFDAAKAIEEEAAIKNERAAAYSTTLIIGVTRKVRDMWFIAGFAIGDGGMAVFDVTDRSLKTMSLPDSGEYAGQTRFLHKSEFANYEDVERRLFFDIRSNFTAIALMTDGITDPKFPTDHAFADPAIWMDFWEQDLGRAVQFSRTNPEMKSQLMGWMDFWSPGNHDDRTLAILLP